MLCELYPNKGVKNNPVAVLLVLKIKEIPLNKKGCLLYPTFTSTTKQNEIK